ncbi:MAG: YitT family protein [Bacteroidales bacterium]|nr:YitT family protein [Bacteroidales bacterium]
MEKKLTFKKVLQETKNYFFIFLGLAMFTFGWSAFLTPYEVSGGGVAGAASILYFATKIPIGLTTFALNAILIAIAWKILGTKFCVNSLICTVVMSVFFSIFQPLFPKPIVDDMFMSVIIGSAIAAYGIGMTINWGGNTGGVDIIALMVGKYRNISYGRVSLLSNVVIVGSSFFVLHDVQRLVYSFVVLLVSIIISDLVIDGYRQTYQFMVFSKKNHEIAQKINSSLHRGATFLKGYGSYNQQESDVLLIVAHKTDKSAITRIIKDIDPNAFITISKTASVFGKNFDNIKI